jgi:HEAT repeat protein
MAEERAGTVSALIEQLQSGDRLQRYSAARQLAEFGGEAQRAVPILKTWIGATDRLIHVMALGAIVLIDKSESSALLPMLIEEAECSDSRRQHAAICMLGGLGELAFSAVPVLRKLLSQDSVVSTSASEAIYDLTGDPTDVIDVGLRLLEHPDWLQRWVGIEHLEYVGREAQAAIAQLEWVAIEDDDEGVRKRAWEAVKMIEQYD